VTIFVSTGDSKIIVDDYVGKNYLEVKGALEARGITVYITTEEVDNPEDYESGEILRQSVEAGEKLSARDSIELFIPDIVTEYPDFTDGTWTEEDVAQFCEEYGVTLKVKREAHSSDDGTIFYQSRREGYTVISGTSLTIKVSDSTAVESGEDDCNPDLSDDCDVSGSELEDDESGNLE
jgi:beta-lactam-binding protein with PASTA domain